MKPDHEKSREELLEEISALRSENKAVRAQASGIMCRRSYSMNREKKTCPAEAVEGVDVTDALEIARVIIDNSPVILFRRLAGDDPRLVYVSDNISRFGYTAREFLSKSVNFKDIVHPEDLERWKEEIHDYARRDLEEYTQHYRILTRSGDVRWIEDRTSLVRDAEGEKLYNQGMVVDITARALAEEELRKSEEKFRRIIETTGEGFVLMDRELNILDANDAFCTMLGYDRKRLVGKKPFELLADHQREFMKIISRRIMVREFRKLEVTFLTRDGRKVPALIHGNILKDDAGRKIGNICFVADLTEQKRTLALAGQVQKNLLPDRAPDTDGLDIAGRSDSCDEVGGDYLDYFEGSAETPGSLRIAVGDISGHGVDAALLMTSARAFIRTQADRNRSPSRMVSSMNRYLSADMAETGHFMSLFLIELDPRMQEARWVRAGHDPALVFHPAEDRFEELGGAGMPLGLDDAADYREYGTAGLAPGTIIALGTDGIWEAVDVDGVPFGKRRLQDLIRSHADEGAGCILGHVFDDLASFTGGAPPNDDVTLVIVKVGSTCP